jgi:hypothetical protein
MSMERNEPREQADARVELERICSEWSVYPKVINRPKPKQKTFKA